MYDRILLPTDDSDGAERAIEHAIDLATAVGARLDVLSVVDDDEFRALEGVDPEEVRTDRETLVEEVAERAADADVDARTAVRMGAPHEAILDHAEEVDADAIVMGTHGRSGVDRVLLGSVTERVVRASPVPVVTVRITGDADGIASAEEAREIATAALADEGHADVEIVDEPHRTSGSWVVPARAGDGTYHVHVDAESGDPRVARLDG